MLLTIHLRHHQHNCPPTTQHHTGTGNRRGEVAQQPRVVGSTKHTPPCATPHAPSTHAINTVGPAAASCSHTNAAPSRTRTVFDGHLSPGSAPCCRHTPRRSLFFKLPHRHACRGQSNTWLAATSSTCLRRNHRKHSHTRSPSSEGRGHLSPARPPP